MFFFSVIGAIQMRYDDDDDGGLFVCLSRIKPGFHYPSWQPELTARVDG